MIHNGFWMKGCGYDRRPLPVAPIPAQSVQAVYIWNRALEDEELEAISRYLAQAWGIP